MIWQHDIQRRRDLQIADISLRWIAGEADVVTRKAGEEAAFAQFRQHVTHADDWQRLPFAAGQVGRAGRSDNADGRAVAQRGFTVLMSAA